VNDNERVIKTYVWHEGQCFFVSTIERDSSAAEGPRRYNETVVWKYDWATHTRGELVFMADAPVGSIDTHQRIVEALHTLGTHETNKEGR
jgi:hypothetical protein